IDSSYTSAVVDLNQPGPDFSRIRQSLKDKGLILRSLRVESFKEELEALHALSLEAFAQNRWYTPLDFGDFFGAYEKLKPHLIPEFVIMAEVDDVLEGFVFALPDLIALPGMKPSLIVKTVAVRPGSRMRGLGSILVDGVQR